MDPSLLIMIDPPPVSELLVSLFIAGVASTKTTPVASSLPITNAVLVAISHSGVGSVKDVSITNYGLEYTGAPKVTFNKKIIIANPTGNYTVGDTLTSFTGTVVCGCW